MWILDSRDVMETLPELGENTFDSCLTDPPYGLSKDGKRGFMGKEWDRGVPSVDAWREVFRVLKPGAHLLAFGGTRTHHRLMCAIEDAGLEIRDCLMWLYGSGWPKALNISKEIDKQAGVEREIVGEGPFASRRPHRDHSKQGLTYADDSYIRPAGHSITAPATPAAKLWSGYGTALKPAFEILVLAMKPCEGTFAENALKWGVGGLNIAAGRIGTGTEAIRDPGTPQKCVGGIMNRSEERRVPFVPSPEGRWPSNLLLSCACGGEHEPDCPVRMLDEQTGDVSPGTMGARHTGKHDNLKYGYGGYDRGPGYGDQGGPSRFFYVSKSSTSERERGLIGHLPCAACGGLDTTHHLNGKGEQVPCRRNNHPTIKPLKLCEYLARLLLPPNPDAQILVPFAGAASEMIGALMAGWETVYGVEIDPGYSKLAEARLQERFPL